MTRYMVFPVCCIFFIACNNNQPAGNTNKEAVSSTVAYKPGLGEFMTSVQIHHAKLWFAGINENWELADFEIHEINEIMDDINTYNSDRPEIKSLDIIHPAIDSVTAAIRQKSAGSFKNSYILLTNTCNECHKNTSHGFNVVKIPDQPPFSNQDFRLPK